MRLSVHGREDVRCVQIGTGDPSGFPYLPESLSEKNLAVELWGVGPKTREHILDLKYLELGASLRQGRNYWWPTDFTSCLVWIVYKTSPEYEDVTMTDNDNNATGTGKEFQYPMVHHASAKTV